MRKDLTELIFILDMSGSMRPMQSDAIGGYNSLIETQKKEPGDANVTTVLFDNYYMLLHDRKDIKDVELLTDKEYVPRGTTALLDAVGRTLVEVGQKLSLMNEEDRPGTVMCTIITDGYENASVEYSWSTVQSMIKEQKEKYNWIFSFIGADIDTMKVSESLGIDSKLSKGFTKSSAGMSSVFESMSKAVSRARCSEGSFSVDDIAEEMSNIK